MKLILQKIILLRNSNMKFLWGPLWGLSGLLFLSGALLCFGCYDHLYEYTEAAKIGTQAILGEISFDSMFFTNSSSYERSTLK